MNQHRTDRVAELLEQTLGMTVHERRSFLAALRDEDADVAHEVDSLLAAYEQAPDALDALAARVLPRALDDLSRALDGDAPLRQQTVGRYEILERLGGGGMGVVYKARDLALGRLAALKFLRTDLAGDADARARLESEARAASALDHPNIGVVYEIGAAEPLPGDEVGDRLFIAMAYYAGETIREKIARGSLPIDEALDYAIQVADGLARAHETGIVHRDIKPANVIVTDRGEAKVLDFGIATSAGGDRTRDGVTRGTIAYMSPEQTRGERVDHRSDLWSFGAMLYEMLTARLPFHGDDDAVLIHAIRFDEPEPLLRLRPDVPPTLASIVDVCLAKNPHARYQHTAELLAALRAVKAGKAPVPAVTRRAQFPRPAAALSALLALALVASAALVARPGPLVRVFNPGGSPPAILDENDATRIVVLPFAPVAPDTALERLGRDLVVTLSAGLDGMGALRTIDGPTTLAQVQPGGALSLNEAHALARRLEANRFIHGPLTRAGSSLRLDASLYRTGTAEPIARVSVRADDPAVLSDLATIALLDRLWQIEPPPVPSLAALTRTRVPAARRAYLEGELAVSRTEMPAAVEAFERAFAADTTFWWAYWRSLYPRSYRETAPADPALVQKVIDHRWELPEPDRRLVEVTRLSRSLTEQVTRLRFVIDHFPNYEPAWWEYADRLVRSGGYLGYTPEDARSAVERVLALNPRFAAAWDHLQSVALVQGDSATAALAGREAARLAGDAARPGRRHLRATLLGSGSIPEEHLREAVDLALSAPPALAEAVSSGLLADGFPSRQIQLNRAVRERAPNRALVGAVSRGEALAWVARGAWDSALVAVDHWVLAAGGADADAELGAYRLTVAGVMLGAVPAAEATRRRSAAASAIPRWSTGLETDCGTAAADLDAADRAAGRSAGRLGCEAQVREAVYQGSELAWLDGMLAYLEHDPARIASARRALYGDSSPAGRVARPFVSPWDSISRPILDRSLAALALDLAGDRERAAREMVAVEREIVNRLAVGQVGRLHPLLTTANRLLAARWLRSLGEDAEAVRLLSWHEAIPASALIQAWNRGIGSVGLLDRAEIAESTGDPSRALSDYTRFLQWYDLPDPALQPLVERALAGAERLSTEPRR